MKLNVRVTTDAPTSLSADGLIVPVLDQDGPLLPASVASALGDKVKSLADDGDFEPKMGKTLLLYAPEGFEAKRVVLVGLGKPDSAHQFSVSQAVSAATRQLTGKKRDTIAVVGLDADFKDLTPTQALSSQLVGAFVGSQGQDLHLTEKVRFAPDHVVLAVDAKVGDAGHQAMERAIVLGESVNICRDLINLPPAELYPESFADFAKKRADAAGLEVEVLLPEQMEEMGMNCILGVGKGSDLPPRMVILKHSKGGDQPTLALVGKGVTFDAGGLCIKPADGMLTMKCDMGGAATVLAATLGIAKLKVPINLITVIPMAENKLGDAAYRPGDVLKAKNGKTIEIINTDAEGRLLLADALCHAVDLGADYLVDLATLTGACLVALGHDVGGLMTNNDDWADRVISTARGVGERVWPLPMYPEYDKLIKSKIADMKNTGGRWGGAITAAKLLVEFVADRPWAHVDIAGPAYADADSNFADGGGTGYFVRSLIALAESLAQQPMPPVAKG